MPIPHIKSTSPNAQIHFHAISVKQNDYCTRPRLSPSNQLHPNIQNHKNRINLLVKRKYFIYRTNSKALFSHN